MMSLTPRSRNDMNIFRMMDDFERGFFSNTVSGMSQFRTDISEKDDAYLLEADLPGFDKDNINIDLDGDVLTISAEQKTENEEKDKDGNYIRRERRYGSFSRSFDVAGIDTENIKADYKDGVLKLDLPKAKEQQPASRRITIGDKN